MKKWKAAALMLIFVLFCVTAGNRSALASDNVFSQADAPETVSAAEMDELFQENGVDYYAYMKLADAEASLEPVILEARRRVMNRFDGWAADGIEAYVTDLEGNIIERVPEFHELFPSDWEQPKCF